MEELRCLVCGIDDGILGEIVKRSLLEKNIKVHECNEDLDNQLESTDENYSYMIIGKDKKKLPKEYKGAFKKNNELIIVELLNNGKSLGLYMNDINEAVLNKIINIKYNE